MVNPLSSIARRNQQMLADAERPLGTRWWGTPLMAVGLGSLFWLHHLVSTGVLAVNFTTSDQQFDVYSNYVQGIASAGMTSGNTGFSSASDVGVSEIGIKEARLAGLCAISHQTLPVIGDVSLMIVAGVPVKPAFDDSALDLVDADGTAIDVDANGALAGSSLAGAVKITDLFVNATNLQGYGNRLSGLNLGRSADGVIADADVNGGQWPAGQTPPEPGGFGLTAEYLNLADFSSDSYGLNLHGSVALPDIRIRTLTGTKNQSDCPGVANS